MPPPQEEWYVIKLDDGRCQVVLKSAPTLGEIEASAQVWGPFPTQGEAIARRVGLIRAHRCEPS
ncbi:MAG TPA: hypothetical protein IGR64_10270 [Leptolyngbyaceae cyanobacterium M65_K2018_010]|nr:hypothetical protein [Leptolyngbyaceae cyanobacterium M65_K2018_010]